MLIDSVKKYSETWWFRTFLFILALTLGFLWYGQDILLGTRGSIGAVATVGNSKITVAEFSRALYEQILRLQNFYNMSLSSEQQKQLYPYVLQSLISEKLIEKEAQRLQIEVPDNAIRRSIKQENQFKDKTGTFDRKSFERFLKNINLTEEAYVNLIRKELTKSNLTQTLFSSISVPKILSTALYRHQNQRRTLTTVTIESKKIKLSRAPTLEEMQAYFKKNPSKFLRPEVRDISIFVFDRSILKDQVKISEEQLIQNYNDRADEFSGKSFEQVKEELRDHLLKQEQSEKFFEIINKIDDAIAGGATLEELSKTYDIPLKKYTQISKEGLIYPTKFSSSADLPQSSLDQKVLQETFTEKEGEVTKVTEGKEGKFFLVHIEKIHQSRPFTFEESKENVEKIFLQALKEEKAKEIAATFESQINKGILFTALAKQYNLQSTEFQVSRGGPLLPVAFYIPENFIATLYTVPLKKAKAVSYLDDENNLNIIIGNVDKIDMPEEIKDKESFEIFEKQLKQEIFKGIYQEYLYSLEIIFPVMKNKEILTHLISKQIKIT